MLPLPSAEFSPHPWTITHFLKVPSLVQRPCPGWLLPLLVTLGNLVLVILGLSGSSGDGSDPGSWGLRTLYLQGEGRLDFSAWNAAIGGAAGGGGTGLQEQQMSRGDIPIIVDACISFVTQHGEWVLVNAEPAGDGEQGHSQGVVICLQAWPPEPDSLRSVTLGKLLCLSEPPFSICKTELLAVLIFQNCGDSQITPIKHLVQDLTGSQCSMETVSGTWTWREWL